MNRLPEVLNDSAWLHGATAFTTIRTLQGRPLLWAEHLARLSGTCSFLGLPDPARHWPAGPGALEPFPQGRLRLTVADSGAWLSHAPLAPLGVPPGGVRVWLGEVRVHPQLAGHKTGNVLPYLLARREAQQQGCFEALLRGEGGAVVDGAISGFVAELDGELLVPTGGLPSLTRACWLGLSERSWREAALEERALRSARQLWLCGSGIGVVPVSALCSPAGETAYPACWPAPLHPVMRVP